MKEKEIKLIPKFDKTFTPIIKVIENFKQGVQNNRHKNLKICVERNGGYNYIYSLNIYADKKYNELNYKVVERIVKTILWIAGGFRIYVSGDKYIFERLKNEYSEGGKRQFDVRFMSHTYSNPFEVLYVDSKNFPKEKKCFVKIGGHLNGCRIGFDAGGSDRKVSAVIDGEVVFSEEVVWTPKTSKDYNYQYNEIKSAFLTASSKMPRVDAIGVSSAGVYIDNKIMVSSLFMNIPEKDYLLHVQNMYLDIAKELNLPIEVANDGDVTALAGAMELGKGNVLGIAMGTSQAGGYINSQKSLSGYINELAFVPVDFSDNATVDEWSGDVGCGVKYLSQDGIIKLAKESGIDFCNACTPYEKLKFVQNLLNNGSETAKEIFADLGVYLAYSLAYYSEFYDIDYVLLLGRVMSGEGGNVIFKTCNNVLKSEFPNIKIKIILPSDKMRRVGQAISAASLKGI